MGNTCIERRVMRNRTKYESTGDSDLYLVRWSALVFQQKMRPVKIDGFREIHQKKCTGRELKRKVACILLKVSVKRGTVEIT